MEQLTIALFQYDIRWESKEENFRIIERWMADVGRSVDLVVLPEMFSTGFTMNPAPFAESRSGVSSERLLKLSQQYQTAFCGSMIISEMGTFKNALFLIEEGSSTLWYDKRHLFSYGGESKAYTPGEERLTFSFRGWKIVPFICYDLRFPVWLRNDDQADLYIGVANWPNTRVEAWKQLLKARAIENQSYVIGVNRVGEEPGGLLYTGYSAAIDFSGETIEEMKGEEWRLVSLSKAKQDQFRDDLPFLKDRDIFELK
jgi:predicted amidohydrolase